MVAVNQKALLRFWLLACFVIAIGFLSLDAKAEKRARIDEGERIVRIGVPMVAPDEFKNYNWRKRSDCRVDFFEMQSGDRPLVRVGSRSYVADEFDPFEIEEILGEVCSSFVSKVLNGLTPNQFVNRRSPKGELKVQNSCKQRRELLDAKVSSRDGILVLLVSENCSAASKALNRALTGHSIDGMVFRSAKNAHPVAFFDGEEISMELHELQDDRMRDLVERIDRGS